MKKLLRVLGVVAALAVIAVVFIVSKLDPQALGAEIMRRVNESGAAELQAERFDLSVRNGLYLQSATIGAPLPSGRLDASVDEMRLVHSLPPLLQGQVVIRAIELDHPSITLTTSDAAASGSESTETAPAEEPASTPDAEPSATDGEAAGKKLELSIERLSIKDGAFVAQTEGASAPDFELGGVNIEFDEIRFNPNTSPVHALTASGSLEVKSLRFGATEATGERGRLALGDGMARIEGLGLQTAAAVVQVKNLTV